MDEEASQSYELEDLPLSQSTDSFEKVDLTDLMSFSDTEELRKGKDAQVISFISKFSTDHDGLQFKSLDQPVTRLAEQTTLQAFHSDHEFDSELGELGLLELGLGNSMKGSDDTSKKAKEVSDVVSEPSSSQSTHAAVPQSNEPQLQADDFKSLAALLSVEHVDDIAESRPALSFEQNARGHSSTEQILKTLSISSSGSNSSSAACSRTSSSGNFKAFTPLPRLPQKTDLSEAKRTPPSSVFSVTVSETTQRCIESLLTPQKTAKEGLSMVPISIKKEVGSVNLRDSSIVTPKAVSIKQEFVQEMQPDTTMEVKEEQGLSGTKLAPTQRSSRKKKTKYELHQEKKQKRLIRNRLSAQLHRHKRKLEAAHQDQHLTVLMQENTELRAKQQHLEAIVIENETLKLKVEDLNNLTQVLQDENLRLKCEVEALKTRDWFDGLEVVDETPPVSPRTVDTSAASSQSDDAVSFFNFFSYPASNATSDDEEAADLSADALCMSTSKKRQRTKNSAASMKAKRVRKPGRRKAEGFVKMAKESSASSKLLFFAFAIVFSFFNLGRYSTPSKSLGQPAGRLDTAFPLGMAGVQYPSVRPEGRLEPKELVDPAMFGLSQGAGSVEGFHNLALVHSSNELPNWFTSGKPVVSVTDQGEKGGAFSKEKKLVTIDAVTGTPSTSRELYVPISRGKMMDYALNRRVEQPSVENSLDEDLYRDLRFREELWSELNKLTELLQAKSFVEVERGEGTHYKELDEGSQAVILYKGAPAEKEAPISKALVKLEAIQTALTSYIHYLSVNTLQTAPKAELYGPKFDIPAETMLKESFILCPKAYGLLHDLTQGADYASNAKSGRKATQPSPMADVGKLTVGKVGEKVPGGLRSRRAEVTEEGDTDVYAGFDDSSKDASLQELPNTSLSMSDFPKLTLIVPSTVIEGSEGTAGQKPRPGGEKQRLVELSCRIETMNELITNQHY